MITQIINAASRAGSAIFDGVSAVASSAYRGLKNVVGTIADVSVSLIVDGYSSSAKWTMDNFDEEHADSVRPAPKVGAHITVARVLLSPFTALPGFIAGLILVPSIYYTGLNFIRFGRLPVDLAISDLYPKYPKPKYAGGLFGIIGAPLGFVLGSVFLAIPTLVARSIYEGFYNTAYYAFNYGLRAATLDDSRDKYSSTDNRGLFKKILGTIPFGMIVGALTFSIAAIGMTVGRMIINGFIALSRNTVRGINIAIFDWEKRNQIPLTDPESPKRGFYKHVLGFPGFLIGLGTAALSLSFITAFRSAYNSLLILGKAFLKGYKKPLTHTKLENRIPDYPLTSNNFKYSEHILGLPGLLLSPVAGFSGFAIGATQRVIIESAISFYNACTKMLNASLYKFEKYKSRPYKQRQHSYEPRIGFLGAIIGVAIMTPFSALIGIGRFAATNITSGNRIFKKVTDPVLNESARPSKKDTRHFVVRRILSIPGVVIGGVIGGIVRSGYESSYSAINTFRAFLKASLAQSPLKDKSWLNTYRTNRKSEDRAWGFLGYALGSIGAVVGLGVVITRIMITNADSAKRSFVASINKTAQEEEDLIQLSPDNRSRVFKAVGTIGSVIGFIFGETGAVTLESMAFFELIVKRAAKGALFETPIKYQDLVSQDEETVNRTMQRNRYRAIPGIILGSVFGSLSFLIIGFGRVLSNTAQTMRHVTLDMIRFVRSDEVKSGDMVLLDRMRSGTFRNIAHGEEYQEVSLGLDLSDDSSEYLSDYEAELDKKSRRDLRLKTPFRLGILGIPLGGVIGSVGALLVGSGRIITSSAVRTYNYSLYSISLALPTRLSLNKYTIEQKPIPNYLGMPLGAVFGVVFGSIGFVFAGVGRVVVNTFISMGLRTAKIANAWPVNYSNPIDDPRDKDEVDGATDKKLGFLGDIIGLATGAAVWTFRVAINVVYNSVITGLLVTAKMSLWFAGDKNKKFILGFDNEYYRRLLADNRSSFEKNIFGGFGYAAVAVGMAIGSVIVTARVLYLNGVTIFSKGFMKVANLALPTTLFGKPIEKFRDRPIDNSVNKIQYSEDEFLEIPKSNLLGLKYLVGLPGLVIGGVLAACAYIIPIGAKNFVANNFKSAKHMGVSLFRTGMEDFYIKGGLGADQRSILNKLVGIPGYILAIGTVGIIPAGRAIMNVAFAIAVGTFSLIIVSPIKAIRILFNPRFKNNPDDQKYQNLVSGLENGKFSGKEIPKGANGSKGLGDFVRKASSLDINTIEEDVIYGHLEAKRANKVLTREDLAVIKEAHHKRGFWTTAMKDRRNDEVDREVDCVDSNVRDYLSDNHGLFTPPRFKKEDRSYTKLMIDERASQIVGGYRS
ncbi:MAG: hypothetical protein P1U74_00630 [Legionellaceae bacterium]|nr:hypothetical protein [Legionellaceae bacterium]